MLAAEADTMVLRRVLSAVQAAWYWLGKPEGANGMSLAHIVGFAHATEQHPGLPAVTGWRKVQL